jgi:hypothetical protein
MNEPWTPGPWDVRYFTEPYPDVVGGFTADNRVGGRYVVTYVAAGISEADARLIAAAPRMAKLLNAWLEYTAERGDTPGIFIDTAELMSELMGEDDDVSA